MDTYILYNINMLEKEADSLYETLPCIVMIVCTDL